jgi:hypothetical protein
MTTEIKIGDKFTKRISKGKQIECTVTDIIKRVSTKTGNVVDVEIWAESPKMMLPFEVSKSTIILSRVK